MASGKNGTLYIGVTKDVLSRVKQHKEKLVKGFTEKYDVNQLVCYEEFQYVHDAITREKNLKKWKRQWKINLIEAFNPHWKCFYNEFGMDSCLRRNDKALQDDNSPGPHQ